MAKRGRSRSAAAISSRTTCSGKVVQCGTASNLVPVPKVPTLRGEHEQSVIPLSDFGEKTQFFFLVNVLKKDKVLSPGCMRPVQETHECFFASFKKSLLRKLTISQEQSLFCGDRMCHNAQSLGDAKRTQTADSWDAAVSRARRA